MSHAWFLNCRFESVFERYVRISNRLVGDYVMTQSNIGNPRGKADSIGVADWSYDEHMTGKVSS